MVDRGDYTKTLVLSQFKGLNLRDNKDYLPRGGTARAQNFATVSSQSLTKKKGTTSLFSEFTFPGSAWRGADFYFDRNRNPYYLAVSYPHIMLVSPFSGFARPIYSSLHSMGIGQFINGGVGDAMWVDGKNKPVYINNGVATQVTWPPSYTNANKDMLKESINATADNPTTLGTDIGFPSLGVFFEGRWYLAGDNLAPQRLYAPKIRSVNFSENTDLSGRDLAFFVDLLTNSPIIAMKVVNNKYLAIFCRDEIHVLQGKFAPTPISPQPQIVITILNPDIGCVGRYAFAEKGNNDLFFLSNRQSLYTLTATENFQDVRPYGLSDKIYPAFQEISIQRMERARLINNNLKGELQLWFPDSEKQYYPNKRFVYDYGDKPEEAEWSEDTGFPLSLRGAFIDKFQNKLILVDRTKFLEDELGLTYDGEPIVLLYEFAPEDFGDRDLYKEVTAVELSYRLKEVATATIFFSHIWDDGKKSGLKELLLDPIDTAVWGEGVYGTSTYSSEAGDPINSIEFKILNPTGKVLKVLIRCEDNCDLTIVDVKLRIKPLSRTGV